MTRKTRIAIFGAGGFGRETAWLLSDQAGSTVEIVCHIEDNALEGGQSNGISVMSWEMFDRNADRDIQVALAVGDPKARRMLAGRIAQAGFCFATAMHSSVLKSDSVKLGEGAIVCAGSILTVNIEIGQHVHINLGCTIGHDVSIGAFSTLSPGVHVSGRVHIGQNVFIGTGATIIDGAFAKPLVIGDGAVIAAGACVTGDVEPGCLYAGVPARLKKRYSERFEDSTISSSSSSTPPDHT